MGQTELSENNVVFQEGKLFGMFMSCTISHSPIPFAYVLITERSKT